MKSYKLVWGLAVALLASPAHAYIASGLARGTGTFELFTGAHLERGEVSPSANPASYQQAEINQGLVGGRYGLGELGPFINAYVSLQASYYSSKAEQVAGSLFYSADDGYVLTERIGADLLHSPERALGFFLQFSQPIQMDIRKFSNPRVDDAALGIVYGNQILPWLGFEGQWYLGTGLGRATGRQNGVIVMTTQLVFKRDEWLLSRPLTFRAGPYFEGDLATRRDPSYQAAFGPANYQENIRTFRVGIQTGLEVVLAEWLALDFAYVQKLFGVYTRATKDFYVGARLSF